MNKQAAKRNFLTRRDLIKALGASLPLASCLNVVNTPESYSIYWLHLEGAPYRALFDLWPSLLQRVDLPGVKQANLKIGKRDLFLPPIWNQIEAPEVLLKNWLSIRGITTRSPHLSQCRTEWFGLEGIPKSPKVSSKNEASLSSLFSKWKKRIDHKANASDHLRAHIIQGHLFNGEFKKFEQINILDKASIEFYNDFYLSLANSLSDLVKILKSHRVFEKSIIMITSDRGRAPASKAFPTILEPVWQGAPLSLISGAIRGPVHVGDIHQEHPKYSMAYPGTWGTPRENWGPDEVYKLINDLRNPRDMESNYDPAKGNPWITPRLLQGFFVKLPPGRIV